MRIDFILTKSTFPLPIMQSIALPTKIGAYSVRPTVTAAKNIDKIKKYLYFPI